MSLSLALLAISLASLIPKQNIDEEVIQRDSKKLKLSWFLGYLWNTHNAVEPKKDMQSRHNQIVQWNGDMNVDQENCSILSPKERG